MKEIRISLKEINLDNDFMPIEHKCAEINEMVDDSVIDLDGHLPIILEEKWPELSEFFLKNRKISPFVKIKSEQSIYKQIRNELIDEIIDGIEAKNINEIPVIDRLANLLESLRNKEML